MHRRQPAAPDMAAEEPSNPALGRVRVTPLLRTVPPNDAIRPRRWRQGVVLSPLVAMLMTGCSTLGPQSIHAGRAAYKEAIEQTGNRQVLDLIVKNRFGENAGLLAVSSVNANFRVSGTINGDIGIGDAANFAGNLVPLSLGAAYEESPTISYTPVASTDYLTNVSTHLPLEEAVLMINGGGQANMTATILLKSINGLRNPAYLGAGAAPGESGFLRFAELLGELQNAELLTLAADEDEAFAYILHDPDPRYDAIVREMMQLLSLRMPGELPVRVPIRLGIGKPRGLELLVATRSIAELIQIASASMDVPQSQIDSGVALPTPPLGAVGDLIDIRSSDSRPDAALVERPAQGRWYYIANDDARSKVYFRLLTRLAEARLGDAARSGQSRPVLTVPVVAR